jgi:dCTP deaminase
MILSNVAIYEALDAGRIKLDPEPSPRYLQAGQDSPYDTHSVDVRLGKFLSVPRRGPYTFDLHQPKGQEGLDFSRFLASNSDQVQIPASGHPLAPNQFVLGQTVERLSLPIDTPANRVLKRCLAARIEGKSSRARTGLLVHFTAPTIHPGFSGTITLEIINLGPVPFVLREGMAIGQLIFEEVEGLPISKEGQFQGQSRPEGNV